jgi:hypothetical protein
VICSSQNPRRDTRLIKLCSMSHRYIVEVADISCLTVEGRDKYPSARNRWHETVEIVSHTQAMTYCRDPGEHKGISMTL